MLSITGSRALSAAMQKAAFKRVLSKDFVRERLYHNSCTTGSASSFFFSVDRRRRDEQHHSISVYQRSIPRYISATIQPQTRWFSATENDRTYRQRVMDRASHMRCSARDSYKDFREHPAESMRSGATSFAGMMRKYGPVFIGTYAAVYLTTLGTLFVGVDSGLLDPAHLFSLFGHVDAGEAKNTVELVVDWMKNHSLTEPYAPFMERNPHLANLAVAWIAVKFTEPVRAGLSLALTPRVSRALGYTITADEEEENNEQDSSEKDPSATVATKTTAVEDVTNKKA